MNIYQQSLRPNQRPIPWRLILIDIPETTREIYHLTPKIPDSHKTKKYKR